MPATISTCSINCWSRWLLATALLVWPGMMYAQDKRSEKEQIIQPAPLDPKTPISYEKDVEPILVNKCNFCHSGNVKRGKLDLSSYEALMRGGDRGKAVIPGKSADSLLIQLSAKLVQPYMPPKKEEPLSPKELAILKLWIDQGAKPPTGARPLAKVALKAPSVTPVLGVAISPEKSIVVASRGNQLHVFDVKTGKYLRSFNDEQGTHLPGAAHVSLVESLAFSPDGKLLASGSYQEVKLWEAASGKLLATTTGFGERVVCLAFSPDGKWLAAGGGAPTQEGELKLLEVPSGKGVRDLKDNIHSDTVFGVAFSPDSKLVVSCGADKFVKTFEVESGKFQKAFEGHTHHVMGVGFTGDGKLIASGGADQAVKIWDYEKGEQVRTINAHGKPLSALVIVGKTSNLATCAGDQQVRLWNASNGGNIRNFTAGNDYLLSLSVSPDGTLVAAGGQEGVVRLYNGTNGALLHTLAPPGTDKPNTPEKQRRPRRNKD